MSIRSLILTFLVFATLPIAEASTPSSGQYRGYVMINRILRERMFEPKSGFELGYYVGQSYRAQGSNLLDLLGTYKSASASDKFRNGEPNAINLVIWHLVFAGIAKDIAQTCTGARPLDFTDEFVSRVRALCAWPERTSQSDAILLDFWLGIMSYDAPLSEFYEWKAFAHSPEMAALKGPMAVEMLAMSVLNNPYFLLRP